MAQGVDYRIPMSARGLDLSGVTDGYMKGKQLVRQNALLELSQNQDARAQETHSSNQNAQKAENDFKSLLKFGLQLKPALESGNAPLANKLIDGRLSEIQSRNGDPIHSLELKGYLANGDADSALGLVNGLISTGQQMGYLKGGVPDELKVGRFRQITLPDGTMASLDTATNQMTTLAEAPSIDLSVIPEGMRDGVSKLPREQQVKVVETFATPQAQETVEAKAKQDEKAMQVADSTKRLVSELLSNEDGLRSAVGAVDEFLPTFSDNTRDAEAALDDLRNLLTVDNLGLMSGVLSESDIKILQSVGSNGLSGSDDRVIGSLKRMAKALGVDVGGSQSGGGIPQGWSDNGDGTYTLPDGRRARRTR